MSNSRDERAHRERILDAGRSSLTGDPSRKPRSTPHARRRDEDAEQGFTFDRSGNDLPEQSEHVKLLLKLGKSYLSGSGQPKRTSHSGRGGYPDDPSGSIPSNAVSENYFVGEDVLPSGLANESVERFNGQTSEFASLVNQTKTSVGLLCSSNAQALGTATLVGKNHVVVAKHCLTGNAPYEVWFGYLGNSDGQIGTPYKATGTVQIDPGCDLAMLTLTEDVDDELFTPAVSVLDPAPGGIYYVMHHAGALPMQVSTFEFLKNDGGALVHDALGSAGPCASGAGVFNHHGELIGISVLRKSDQDLPRREIVLLDQSSFFGGSASGSYNTSSHHKVAVVEVSDSIAHRDGFEGTQHGPVVDISPYEAAQIAVMQPVGYLEAWNDSLRRVKTKFLAELKTYWKGLTWEFSQGKEPLFSDKFKADHMLDDDKSCQEKVHETAVQRDKTNPDVGELIQRAKKEQEKLNEYKTTHTIAAFGKKLSRVKLSQPGEIVASTIYRIRRSGSNEADHRLWFDGIKKCAAELTPEHLLDSRGEDSAEKTPKWVLTMSNSSHPPPYFLMESYAHTQQTRCGAQIEYLEKLLKSQKAIPDTFPRPSGEMPKNTRGTETVKVALQIRNNKFVAHHVGPC